ncbi:MAG: hypothetical protein K0A95_01450 [Chromatiales bacterium]|nr:hypothetical protein [Chromatiales bacterium]
MAPRDRDLAKRARIAGVVLLIMVVFLDQWVASIPMSALVTVMIMVATDIVNWESLRNLKAYPPGSNIVMVATVVVLTHNLAYGVLMGVLLAAIFFARKVAQVKYVASELSEDGDTRRCRVVGQVFFASVDKFVESFDFNEAVDKVD